MVHLRLERDVFILSHCLTHLLKGVLHWILFYLLLFGLQQVIFLVNNINQIGSPLIYLYLI